MRRLHKAITFLLILLCIAGAVFAFVFLRKEQQIAAKRQQEINEVAKQLEPLNAKRREWEKKDKEWQAVLADKQTGRTCVLLSFDYMGRELYDTIFELMDQYGFRGTFAMRNGRMPSWESEKQDEFSSGEMMQEILDSGWDYAVSVGETPDEDEEEEAKYKPDFSEEFGDMELESETSESESEATDADDASADEQDETETDAAGFVTELDSALANISEKGYTQPQTVFCTQEQFGETTAAQLFERGFTMASVKDTQEIPVIAQEENQNGQDEKEKLWVIDTGVYTQRNDQLEKQLDTIVSKQQSVAIFINEIVKISQDIDYDLNLTTFTSLLNYLKELENDRKINVLTYSEYYQYEQLREQAYETALAEYAAFREEMLAAFEELDMQEAQIAKQLNETESAAELSEDRVEDASDMQEGEAVTQTDAAASLNESENTVETQTDTGAGLNESENIVETQTDTGAGLNESENIVETQTDTAAGADESGDTAELE